MDTFDGDYCLLETEHINPNSSDIDLCNSLEIVTLINKEDKTVAYAVEKALPQIAKVIDRCYEAIREKGHIYYAGSGTSGRLGVLDASECVPTFGVSRDLVQGIIAGGDKALRVPTESCEDNEELGKQQIVENEIDIHDVVIGISASGSAKYVIGALKEAKARGAGTVAIVNNRNTNMTHYADILVEAITGPEVISGSTRMKAGTSQKMILNMISTATMIKLGKVYKNLMIDLKASNQKLEARAKLLFCLATGKNEETAKYYLEKADMDTKLAIAMCHLNMDSDGARAALAECDGHLRKIMKRGTS